MTRKGEKISFRITEEKFEALTEIVEKEEISISELCQDYANTLKETNCQVEVVPIKDGNIDSYDGEEYPPKTIVTTQFIREHERLELETDHLRESLYELKTYKQELESQLSDNDVISLEAIDRKNGNID